jgi:hypothetical protein
MLLRKNRSMTVAALFVGRPFMAAAGFPAGLDALESASAGKIACPTVQPRCN